MTVRSIAYVEIYTRNQQSTVEYFTTAMGFHRGTTSEAADRRSVPLHQGQVRLRVTAGPATSAFLDEHGEGVADIAVACDDVAQTREAALAAGARSVGEPRGLPVVSGFGGVVHTLLPHTDHDRGETAAETDRIRLLDHVAICVGGGSLDRWADHYNRAFGCARYSTEYVDTGDQGMDSVVVRNPTGEVTFTFVAPDPHKQPGQLDAFLDRNAGAGVQHLAFLVDDIIPAVGEFRDRGVRFLSTPDTYYDMLSERFAGLRDEIADLRGAQVLADRDEWGYLLQLFSRSPHERNTLFYELIQRRGSRGFGSANIRALYEAVERDRLAAG